MNLPNKITLSRILTLPIFMAIMLVPDWGTWQIGNMTLVVAHVVGTLIFIIAAVTDWVDGYIARKNNLITNLGKFLDPIADKLLISTGLIVLIDIGGTFSWMAALILGREFAVTGLRLVLANEGEVVAAAMLGKVKTWFQIVAVCICLLGNFPFGLIGVRMDIISMVLTVIITLWSGWAIFWANRFTFLNSK